MLKHIWINPIKNSDLKVYQYGQEKCKAEHSFGPANRDHFLLHFVTKGKGVFVCENKRYELSEGQGFLIVPGITTSYLADKDDPWTYSWVGFSGTNAEEYLRQTGLGSESPIFAYKKTKAFAGVFSQLKTLDRNTIAGQVAMIGNIYILLSLVMENANPLMYQGQAFFSSKENYIKSAISYIHLNYSRKITVSEIADYVGLNRCYFGSIFKELTKKSPQDFIMDFRMSKAKIMLSDITMSIGDVSRSVGYEDPLLFSRLFKKNVGVSPNAYRKSIT